MRLGLKLDRGIGYLIKVEMGDQAVLSKQTKRSCLQRIILLRYNGKMLEMFFCDADESVEHLFLSCPCAEIVWCIIFTTYNISPPTNIKNMLGN
jgi:hypothetical protein